MWKLIILKWDSFVLAITTTFYGIWIIIFPQIMEKYQVYQIVDEYFNHKAIGLVFLILGLIKLYGILKNKPSWRRFALAALSGVWMLFSISFLLSSPPNTLWLFSGSMAFLSFGIALRDNI